MSSKIQRILVSQPKPSSPKSPYFQIAKDRGVTIDFKPFFQIKPLSARHFRDQKIDILAHTGVVLSSRTMVDHFFGILKELRLEVDSSFKYYCPSEVISLYLQKYITVRKRKVFFPEKSTQTPDMLSLLAKHSEEKIIIPTTKGYNDDLFEQLDAQGVVYTKAILSEVDYTTFAEGEIEQYDLLLFFSPNGVASLFHNRPNYEQGQQLIGCLGEGTKKALEEKGIHINIAVPNTEFQSITEALDHFLAEREPLPAK